VKARGFTLIEVLVALAIVTVGMAALLGALSSAAGTSLYLRDKMFAEWIALNRVEELRLQFRRPSKGKSDGQVEYAGRRWRWEQEVFDTDVPGIQRMEVRVRPAEISASTKGSWFTTTQGLIGDAISPPRGDISEFRRPTGQPNPGGGGGDEDEPQQPPRPDGAPDPGTPPQPEPLPQPTIEPEE
jgi:general secretion pathway protein I